MLAYKYTITNNFNGESIILNAALDSGGACFTDSGSATGARLTVYPTFELEIRNEDQDKLGQHGVFDYPSFYGKRNIEFQGLIVASNHQELISIEERMKRIFTLPAQPIIGLNDGYINIQWVDALGTDWNINAKIQSDLEFSRNIGVKTEASFIIQLKASDPIIRTTTENQQNQLLGWIQSQMTLPTFLPNNFNNTLNNEINIYQSGTADAQWRARLYGPGSNPKVTLFKQLFSDETLLSNFSNGWSGDNSDDNNIFQTAGISQKMTSVNGVRQFMRLTGALDLTTAQFVSFYINIDDINNLEVGDYLTGENYIKFIENDGVDEFVVEYNIGNPTLRSGWNYFYILRDEFEIIGNPSWNNITNIEFSIKSKAGTTVNVIFDDLKLRNITRQESKLEVGTTLGVGEFLEINIKDGTILKNGVTDVSGFVTIDSDFFTLLPKENILMYQSSEDPNITWVTPTQPIEFFWNDALL